MNTGFLQHICRYPLKSALGERLEQAEIGESGLSGDRRFALIDRESGKVVSAKRPKLWRSMLLLAAETVPGSGALSVKFPDGREMTSGSSGLVPALSDFVGRSVDLASQRRDATMLDRSRPDEVLMSGLDADVTMDVNPLAAETPGTGFQDLAPIHVVCTATLQAVAAAVHRAELEFHRYRPNFVVMMKDAAPFCENDWVGRELQMGSVRLKVTRPTPRCAIPTLAHGAGDQFRPAILEAINRMNRTPVADLGPLPCIGAYARVVKPGIVGVGDVVKVD